MNYLSKFICLTVVILFYNNNISFASHIIGGEMTYSCLGNGQYQIRLTIFKDCASINNTGTNTDYDNPVSIGVFSAQGVALSRVVIPFVGLAQTLNLSVISPCYNIPQDLCVQTYTYTRQISLPFRAGGYHLAYQRCCRNAGIVNIVDPFNTGATYDVRITQAALSNCDNSPRFREWPPFYVCVNTPIDYDHSAFDLDGDSIAYRLCNPFSGADVGDPQPTMPSSPAYPAVIWQPPYNINNMMGGPNPLRIDPVTGRLTGIPPNIGNFVVGICAIEYRNGVEIGHTKRDFQYFVRGNCIKRSTAQFAANVPPCNNTLSILHTNTSIGNTSFNWSFGDNTPILSGTSPVHTYPDTGTYLVKLYGFPCVDSTERIVNVNLDGVKIVAPPQIACIGDTVQLIATNGLAAYNSFLTYNWTPSNLLLSGQGTNTVSVVANNNVNLLVQVTNDKGCTGTQATGVQLQIVEAAFDSIQFNCNTSLNIPFQNTSTSVTNGFLWNFAGTGTSTQVSPSHTFPDTGTYAITLIAGIGALCQDTLVQDIYIPLDGAQILSTSPLQACKDDTVTLSVTNLLANYNNINGYVWNPSSLILSGQGTDSILVVADTNMTFTVNVVNNNGCTDTIETFIEILQINAVFDSVLLECNKSLIVPFKNTSVDTSINFLWDFGGAGTSTLASPIFTFPDTGMYLVQMIGGIGTQCPDTFLQNLHVRINGAEISASDSQLVCRGDTVLLRAYNQLAQYNDIVNYSWTPAANILTGQGTDSVDAYANGDISFYVVGLNNEGCRDTAMAHVNVTIITPALAVLANPDSIFVGQTSQLYATNLLQYTYDWTTDPTLSAYNIHNPKAKPRVTTTYYVTVTNQYCSIDDSVTVFIKEPICGNPVVFVPNAFSPDGDGHNDILMVNGNNINEMTMAIYNRWGQKIFETNDQNIGWDGTFKGQALPPDVYGYYMQCQCDDGSSLFLKGNITLLK